jgi:hypothetical protein
LLYAQILYEHEMYKAAAPIFEQALTKLGDDQSQSTMRRVTTDQAGMSYGMSGDISKARAIFEAAVAKDPDYRCTTIIWRAPTPRKINSRTRVPTCSRPLPAKKT